MPKRGPVHNHNHFTGKKKGSGNNRRKKKGNGSHLNQKRVHVNKYEECKE